MPGSGFFPTSATTGKSKPEPACENCKRLLTGLDRVAHTTFHWQALAVADEFLHPPKEEK